MAVSKKKKIFLSIFLPSLMVTIFVFTIGIYWLAELLLQGHYTKEGIENYSPSASSVSLCSCLTLREERRADEYFINKWPLINSYYRYEHDYDMKHKLETVLLSLTYSEDVYEEAFENISIQQGFTKEVFFDYCNYSFCLNDTERIMKGVYNQDWSYTSFDVNDNCIYLKWINLVGWCEKKHTLVFIGFYYEKNNRGYTFNSWDEMFSNYFNFYNW